MSSTSTRHLVISALAAGLIIALPGLSAAESDMQATAAPASSPFEIVRAALVWDAPVSVASAGESGSTQRLAVSIPSGPLPVCQYKDKRTRYYRVKHWRKTLLDTNLRIRRGYAPRDLVSVSRANLRGTGSVRKVIIADLKAMANAARKAGKPLAVRSAYRSYATQVATFNSWVRRSGYQQALKFSARPGHSEHQLGTTLDFTVAPGQPLSSSFGNTKQGRWLARNAWKFGFIMPYPKGKTKVSCYGYEPWHWRYVGRDLADKIFHSGQVPRRYYWRNFETAP